MAAKPTQGPSLEFGTESAALTTGANSAVDPALVTMRPVAVQKKRFKRPDIWLKPTVFCCSLVPFGWLVFALLTNQLGANPIETITDFTGEWALRFILLGLCLTPLRQITKQTWPVRLRRMVGLFAFFYALLHVITWAGLDHQLAVADIIEDILERPYITAGTVAFVIMLALAITSPKRMVRKLGKRWQALHRWVYVLGAAAIVHYVWLARGDRLEPFIYLGILAFLLGYRLVRLASAR